MAFNLLAEFPQPPDWAAVHSHTVALRHVHVFPIPPAALGISLPLSGATEQAWPELRALLLGLLGSHSASVVELYGGTHVTPQTLDLLRATITGPA
jgi:hypothetical protein